MKTRNLLLTALFAAFTIVFAQLVVPLPFTPVQISLSIMGAFLSGLLLGPKYGALSQLVYLLLAVVGLPVLGKFTGGAGALLGPTGGYVLAYPIMAFFAGYFWDRFGKKTFVGSLPGMLLGLAVCYVIGTIWLSVSAKMGIYQAFLAGVAPFLVFDLVKIVCCGWIARLFLKRTHLFVR